MNYPIQRVENLPRTQAIVAGCNPLVKYPNGVVEEISLDKALEKFFKENTDDLRYSLFTQQVENRIIVIIMPIVEAA